MLEVTIVFTVFALFFLFVYMKLRGERRDRISEEARGLDVEPLGYIERVYPFLCVTFAVICFFIAYSSAVLGDVGVSVSVANVYGNQSITETSSKTDWYLNETDESTVLGLTSTFFSYVQKTSNSTTLSTLPVVTSTTTTTSTGFSQAQVNFLTGIYSLMIILAFGGFILYIAQSILKAVLSVRIKWEKRQQGDYDKK